jgi:hypothetical protein
VQLDTATCTCVSINVRKESDAVEYHRNMGQSWDDRGRIHTKVGMLTPPWPTCSSTLYPVSHVLIAAQPPNCPIPHTAIP